MMDKLNFLTAGIPLRAENKGYKKGFEVLKKMNLDGLELEFVHGVRMSPENRKTVKTISSDNNMVLTAHCPFYINLNSREEEKIDASIYRIIDTALVGDEVGAYSITYHAAFYLGNDKETVYKKVLDGNKIIIDALESNNINLWVRPETTGKSTQWGDLDEVIRLSKEFKQVLPCVDFSHLHARSNGEFNTYDEFSRIFERIGNEIGNYALENFHGHVAGIAYSSKGEKHHLILEESDMNYKDLLKAFKDFNIKGVLVCESPNIEDDCKLIKEYYESL